MKSWLPNKEELVTTIKIIVFVVLPTWLIYKNLGGFAAGAACVLILGHLIKKRK